MKPIIIAHSLNPNAYVGKTLAYDEKHVYVGHHKPQVGLVFEHVLMGVDEARRSTMFTEQFKNELQNGDFKK